MITLKSDFLQEPHNYLPSFAQGHTWLLWIELARFVCVDLHNHKGTFNQIVIVILIFAINFYHEQSTMKFVIFFNNCSSYFTTGSIIMVKATHSITPFSRLDYVMLSKSPVTIDGPIRIGYRLAIEFTETWRFHIFLFHFLYHRAKNHPMTSRAVLSEKLAILCNIRKWKLEFLSDKLFTNIYTLIHMPVILATGLGTS